MHNKEDAKNYGIVYTPKNLVDQILDLIPRSFFSNKEHLVGFEFKNVFK